MKAKSGSLAVEHCAQLVSRTAQEEMNSESWLGDLRIRQVRPRGLKPRARHP